VEQADVVLTGHQHPTGRARPGASGELTPFGGVEMLLVDPVEQLDGAGLVAGRRDPAFGRTSKLDL
jgi:hypothetical protein